MTSQAEFIESQLLIVSTIVPTLILTGSRADNYIGLVVLKRLTNLLLVLAVGGGVGAGMPFHSGHSESGMMDCCKTALEHIDSPRVTAARLCCAMNCNQPASTNGNTSQSLQTRAEATPLAVITLPPKVVYKSPRSTYSKTTLETSKPAYILNLALLI